MKNTALFKRALASLFMLGMVTPTAVAAEGHSLSSQPVQLVVGFSAGGPADTVARTLSQRLGELLNTSVVIVNRPGADGVLSAGTVARARPDGHTLLLAPSTLAINESLYNNLNYDTRKDFIPVGFIGESPNIIGVHPSLPVHNIKDLVEYTKSAGKPLFYGSTSSVTLLATEMFALQTGAKMERVPYKGAGQAIPALLSGEVQAMISSVVTLLPHVQSGSVRAIAVTSRSRLPIAPDIVPAAEQGLEDYSASTWYGLFAPAGTPRPIVERLAAALQETLEEPGIRSVFESQGTILDGDIDTPKKFDEFFHDEIDKWKEIVRASGTPTN